MYIKPLAVLLHHMESGCDIRWESTPFFIGVCLLLKSYSTTLLSLITLKVHVEWTHTLRGGRMSSFITCSGYKVSQHLGKFQVSACLADTSWKSLGDRPLTKPDRCLTRKMPKACRCKDTRSRCGSVLCVSTRWIWIPASLSMCLIHAVFCPAELNRADRVSEAQSLVRSQTLLCVTTDTKERVRQLASRLSYTNTPATGVTQSRSLCLHTRVCVRRFCVNYRWTEGQWSFLHMPSVRSANIPRWHFLTFGAMSQRPDPNPTYSPARIHVYFDSVPILL